MEHMKTRPGPNRSRVALAALALLGTTAAFAQDTTPVNSNLPPGALPSSWDPHYNVCRGVDPKCYRDWVGAANRQDKVLIYSRTAGPRHANLGTPLAAGRNTQATATSAPSATPALNADNIAQVKLREWLNAEGISADITEDVTQLSNLTQYKAVIFVSTSRDNMWKHGTAIDPTAAVNVRTSAYLDAAKVNLRQYIRAGGAFVGIHNALGTEYNWPWYEGLMGNTNYYDHGANQLGTAKVVGSADASTAGVPTSFPFRDEWYNLVPYPTNVKYVLTVDENTLATRRTTHPGHGNFHPVAWCQYYDGGRVWMTSLGHDTTAFTGLGTATSGVPPEGYAAFKQLMVQGIKSAMGLTSFCTR